MATVAARGKQVPHHTSPCTAVPYIPVSSYRDEDEGLDFGSLLRVAMLILCLIEHLVVGLLSLSRPSQLIILTAGLATTILPNQT